MEYIVDQVVKVRKNLKINKQYGPDVFVKSMQRFTGEPVIIIQLNQPKYIISGSRKNWTNEMFEGAYCGSRFF